ncbi:MAG: ATP-binding protein [Vulcanimicrobiaceae bacterium]
METSDLVFHLLGPPRIVYGGQALRLDLRPRSLPLIACLSLAPHHSLAPRDVAERVWASTDDQGSLETLRRHLHDVHAWAKRHALPSELLVRRDGMIALDTSAITWCDAWEFERAYERNEWLRAIDGYAGPLLEGIDHGWIVARRDDLRRRHETALERQLELELEQHAWQAAEAMARRALADDPLRERALRGLMTALAEGGQRARALTEYDLFAERLGRDRHAAPSHPTRTLRDRIATERRIVAGAPPVLTSFVGRAGEIEEVTAFLQAHRIVTIVGAPGVGKTRLALEVAQRLAPSFTEGAAFVSLAGVREPEAVASALAAATVAADARSLARLLVVDNAEHVVAAVAEHLPRALSAAPLARAIVTSRAALRCDGEAIQRLEPLAIAPLGVARERLLAYDGTALFLERAGAIVASIARGRYDPEAVTRIVRAVDGVPLGIELAAARLRSRTLTEIADELEHSAPGSLAGAFEWAYAMLPPELQRTLRNLAVARGAFTREAAGAIADCDAVDLERLVEQSLLCGPDPEDPIARFTMLEPIRRAALAELARCGEHDEATARLARWTMGRYIARMAELRTGRAYAEYDCLEEEYAAIELALAWALDEGRDIAGGLDLCLALSRYWSDMGTAPLMVRWFDRALSHPELDRRRRLEGTRVVAQMLRNGGDYRLALERCVAAVAAERANDPEAPEVALAIVYAANAHRLVGEFTQAHELAAEAERNFEARGRSYYAAFARSARAAILYAEGRPDEADAIALEALDSFVAEGASGEIAMTWQVLGACDLARGRLQRAIDRLERAVRCSLEAGTRYVLAYARLMLGVAQRLSGDRGRAVTELREGVALAREIADVELRINALENAALALGDEDSSQAWRALEVAARERERFHLPRAPGELPLYERIVAGVGASIPSAERERIADEARGVSVAWALERIACALDAPAERSER